jgi:hypothetical protein
MPYLISYNNSIPLPTFTAFFSQKIQNLAQTWPRTFILRMILRIMAGPLAKKFLKVGNEVFSEVGFSNFFDN